MYTICASYIGLVCSGRFHMCQNCRSIQRQKKDGACGVTYVSAQVLYLHITYYELVCVSRLPRNAALMSFLVIP